MDDDESHQFDDNVHDEPKPIIVTDSLFVNSDHHHHEEEKKNIEIISIKATRNSIAFLI